ncbi:conserved hypothetical protein [Candidatus Desulfarcum epimagneticum]|uniref:DUF2867 domain-containing protein n=1 Tax=uncultured Desulfobacteraceae bacterium TaxID=218296 RepID=A0A484HHM5_9BACT|nr:conserved hypothetical protein [uncultured Desulfobacteraceae bacterium]
MDSPKTLIDLYLPEYSFNECHDIVVNRSIERVYQAARNFDLSKSKRIKILFKLRGLPTERLNLQDFIKDVGFTNLEENPPLENLIGFWAKTKIEPVTGREDFIHNAISARVKVVWNFRFQKLSRAQTRVSTETRVLCVSPGARVTFGAYWSLIKPFSGAIRKKMLQIIRQDSESMSKSE